MHQTEADMSAQQEAPACVRLEAAMATLSPVSRRVVELWLGGLSRSQMAAELSLGEDEIARIGGKAIEQVRHLLGESTHEAP